MEKGQNNFVILIGMCMGILSFFPLDFSKNLTTAPQVLHDLFNLLYLELTIPLQYGGWSCATLMLYCYFMNWTVSIILHVLCIFVHIFWLWACESTYWSYLNKMCRALGGLVYAHSPGPAKPKLWNNRNLDDDDDDDDNCRALATRMFVWTVAKLNSISSWPCCLLVVLRRWH